jgi:hypothetical protein
MTKQTQKKWFEYFERRKRNNGDYFYCLTEGAPDELCNLVRDDIHRQLCEEPIPNDWLYETIAEAFEALEDDDIEDVSIESDVYDSMLLDWMKESYAQEFCIEAEEELGESHGDILAKIGYGQWFLKTRIYEKVDKFMKNN